MDLAPTIKRVQAHFGLKPDGVAGPLTWGAISRELFGDGPNVPPPHFPDLDPNEPFGVPVDDRSESNIDTLLPVVRPLARSLITIAKENGINAKVTSGYRTYEEQAELYAKHQAGGPQAAPPGYSNHNFALAFDVTLFDDDGKPIWESPLYSKVGEIGKHLGLDWGGDWSNSDEPHFEFRPDWARGFSESQALAEYRQRQKVGVSIV